MSNWYHAAFSNSHTIRINAGQRYYSHAWHARGHHKLTGEPWSFQGFSGSGEQAAINMRAMIAFAPAGCVAFAEVVAVALSAPRTTTTIAAVAELRR